MKSERERQIPYDITYMWNLKYDKNEPIYKKQNQIHRPMEQTCGCQMLGEGEGQIGSLGLVDANYYIQNG